MADVHSNGQSAAAQQTLAKSINDLADEDLAKIFKYLPLEFRLLVSEVSKRWHKVTRRPWRDVVSIDLSSTDPTYFVAFIKQSPNLQNVFAKGNAFWRYYNLRTLSCVRLSMSLLKLYDCSFVLKEKSGPQFALSSAIFPANTPAPALYELVLHGPKAVIYIMPYHSRSDCSVIGAFPTTLERLQISGGLNFKFEGRRGNWEPKDGGFLDGLGRLQNLTCLILCSLPSSVRTEVPSSEITLIERALFHTSTFRELTALKNLVELCIGWPRGNWDDWSDDEQVDVMEVCFGLPKLEVLFVHNGFDSEKYLRKMIMQHPRLRILVITGDGCYYEFHEDSIPARRLYPNGFSSDPLPFLHVFLDCGASREVAFAESASDALKVHRITQPSLPSFLEKEDIAPIFEGVWIAGQIKEGAKHGAKLFDDLYDFP